MNIRIHPPKYILPLIVFSQFAGTSLWFVGNAILPDIQKQFNLNPQILGHITTAVQLGFICGTLIFAVLMIADRFSSPKVFFVSSLIAACFNILVVWLAHDSLSLLVLRFCTGFFLAGIYPVGMKIAADWFEKGLGKALGFLVGALVLGTAFPHLLKGNEYHLPWKQVLFYTSFFAFAGGVLVLLFVKEGPFRHRGQQFHPAVIKDIFRKKNFRSAAFGYFGHMWELYTFWAFVPVLLQLYANSKNIQLDISFLSFIIIAVGSISCILGGYLSQKITSSKVAFYSLLISGTCCLIYPLFMNTAPFVYLLFLVCWGIAVIADSPQFSALVAQTAPAAYKGSALTLITCVGFSITVVSIQLMNFLFYRVNFFSSPYTFMLLGIGPAFGLKAMRYLVKEVKF